MLRIFNSFPQLDFDALMAVYAESNSLNASEFYPREEPGVALCQVERDFEEYLRMDFFRSSGAFYAIWDTDGYASALRMEPYRDGWLLQALETAPQRRRCGYAGALIRAVQQLPGVDKIYSHVSLTNRESMAVHRACGFSKVLDYAVYLDGSVNAHSVTLCWEKKPSAGL